MPHIIIECSEDIIPENPENFLLNTAEALARAGSFNAMAIKTRLQSFKYSTMGLSSRAHAFVAAEIVLLDNKTPEELDKLTEAVQKTLFAYFKNLKIKTNITTRVTKILPQAYKRNNNF